MKKPYILLDHTADAYIEAYGSNLQEAFGNAALGMMDVMTKVELIENKIENNFIVQAQDKPALLYSWLEELLIEFELKNMLYSRFDVWSIEKNIDGFKLNAKAWGEKYDAEKHPSKVGIKAVTYHQMDIIENLESVILRFILDI